MIPQIQSMPTAKMWDGGFGLAEDVPSGGPASVPGLLIADEDGRVLWEDRAQVLTAGELLGTGTAQFIVYAPNVDKLYLIANGSGITVLNYLVPSLGASYAFSGVTAACYNPNDGFIYACSIDRTIHVFDPVTNTAQASLDFSANLPATGSPRHLVYCDTGVSRIIAVAHYAGGVNSRVYFFNAQTGAFISALTLPTNDPYSLLYLDGDTLGGTPLLYVGAANVTARIHVINMLTLAYSTSLVLGSTNAGSLHFPAYAPSSRYIYWPFTAGSPENRIFVVNPAGLVNVTNIAPGLIWPSSCAYWETDGRVMVTYYDNAQIQVINTLTNTIDQTLTGTGVLIHGLAAPNGRFFSVVGNPIGGNKITYVDTAEI